MDVVLSTEIQSETEFFVILSHFLPFSWKSKFWKIEMPGDSILLHMCTINENHMMYDSWNIRHDRQDFLSFWAIFYPSIHFFLATIKIKISKIEKTPGDIIMLHICTINNNQIMYYHVWFLRHGVWHNFLSFWTVF